MNPDVPCYKLFTPSLLDNVANEREGITPLILPEPMQAQVPEEQRPNRKRALSDGH